MLCASEHCPLNNLPLRKSAWFWPGIPDMEQQEVKDKLKTGELKRKTHTGKSEVWKTFKLIVENATETCVGFAECQCGFLLAYDSKKTGTSTLSRHLKGPSSLFLWWLSVNNIAWLRLWYGLHQKINTCNIWCYAWFTVGCHRGDSLWAKLSPHKSKEDLVV